MSHSSPRNRNSAKFSGSFLLVASALLVMPSGCAADGLIGGECAEGYAFCSEECISITDDEANCGSCDVACPRNLACIDALCGGPDGTVTIPGTGGMGGMGPGTGGGFGGINTGAGGPGGNDGVGGSPTGGTGGGGNECLPPYNSAAFCGDCDTQCGGATPNCTPDGDGGYECAATCTEDPFVTECGDMCVDTMTDPRHCGACNNRCDSGICSAGSCVGSVSGHMAAICMSYETASPSQTRLIGNAVFLAAESPVRILAYSRGTSAASLAGTNQALAAAAAARGRTFERTNVTGLNAITNQLDREDYDVLLIYDQQGAPAGEMASRATAWGPTIQTFTQLGGVVVILTGGGGTSEVHELIDGLGLVSTTGTINYDDGDYIVSAPGDALAVGVVSPFRGVETSCVFSGTPMSDSELSYVTAGDEPGPGNGDPGVVHRIIVP